MSDLALVRGRFGDLVGILRQLWELMDVWLWIVRYCHIDWLAKGLAKGLGCSMSEFVREGLRRYLTPRQGRFENSFSISLDLVLVILPEPWLDNPLGVDGGEGAGGRVYEGREFSGMI